MDIRAVLIVSVQLLTAAAGSFFSEGPLRGLSEKLGSRLYRLTKDSTGLEEIEKGFATARPTFAEIRPEEAVQRAADKISEFLQKKVVAIKRLVEIAEEAAKGHRWNSKINISYVHAKEPDLLTWGYLPLEFHPDERFFNESVNLHSSTVHVPTNVFHHDTGVQNGVEWSQQLDISFRDIFDKDPSIKSQSFCSTTGFGRMFPGVRWPLGSEMGKEAEKSDLFDCRLTKWFIRASSSPKDVLILLDISGSMTGLRRETAKRTAIEIMNTLTGDDFFNILTFTNEVSFLDPALNESLIQMSEGVRRRFTGLLHGIKTHNFANYTVALPFAFEVLERAQRSADCTKAIMIISDTAPDAFEDIISKFNAERRIRIFTYVIGREVTEYESMAKMACYNRGFVGHIVTLADIRDFVEEHYLVSGRPMVLMRNHTTIWSGAYQHPLNLGTIMTLAQPVFNRSAEAGMKGSLLGVMALDVALDDLFHLLAPHKWGVGSYVFGVDHNGRILFHPNWKHEEADTGSVRPIHNDIDLMEVEKQTEADDTIETKLRAEMLNQVNGSLKAKVLRFLDGFRRIVEREYLFSYAAVKGTPFSVALATPVGLERFFTSKLQLHGVRRPREAEEGRILSTTLWSLHPHWHYCNVTIARMPALMKHLKGLVTAERNAENDENSHLKCDRQLIESIIFDAKATEKAGNTWVTRTASNGDLRSLYGLSALFVATRSGLTRWIEWGSATSTNSSSSFNCVDLDDDFDDGDGNITCSADQHVRGFFEQHLNSVDESFYERTITGIGVTVSPGLQIRRNHDYRRGLSLPPDKLLLTLPVFIADDRKKTLPVAVTGLIMAASAVPDMMREISKDACKGTESCHLCQSSSTQCYLLDENGYIVSDARYTEHTGKFFGSLYGEVMIDLIDRGIFKEYLIKDAQGVCHPQEKMRDENSASSWRGLLVESLFQLTKSFSSLLVSLFLFCLDLVAPSEDYYQCEAKDENGTFIPKTMLPPPYLCDTRYALYANVWNESRTIFEMECLANCTKNVAVHKVLLTNLILVVLDTPRSCPCIDLNLSTEPEEDKLSPAEVQYRFQKTRDRKRPGDCFPYFQEEDFSYCASPYDPYLKSLDLRFSGASVMTTSAFVYCAFILLIQSQLF